MTSPGTQTTTPPIGVTRGALRVAYPKGRPARALAAGPVLLGLKSMWLHGEEDIAAGREDWLGVELEPHESERFHRSAAERTLLLEQAAKLAWRAGAMAFEMTEDVEDEECVRHVVLHSERFTAERLAELEARTDGAAVAVIHDDEIKFV